MQFTELFDPFVWSSCDVCAIAATAAVLALLIAGAVCPPIATFFAVPFADGTARDDDARSPAIRH